MKSSAHTLTRAALRQLKPGQSRMAGGIVYERLVNDGRWSVNVMISRVRRHQVVGLESEGYTRVQAEALLVSLKASKRERMHGIAIPQRRMISLREAAARYLAYLRDTGGRDIAKKRQRLEQHLLPQLGSYPLATLTETDIKRYRARRLEQGAAAATINRELAVVSHVFSVTSDRQALGLIPAAPCRVPRLREPESKTVYLQPAQVERLLAAAQQDENEHVALFCCIGLHTGMRRDSILRLRIQDIDLLQRVIWVNRDKAGERQQPMTAELAEYLGRAITQRELPSHWLFPSSASRTGHVVNIYKAFRRVVDVAGLSAAITPHTLRHTMATNAAHAGVDAATLQAIGGWKTRRMVERYTHAGSLQSAMDTLQRAYRGDAGATPNLSSTIPNWLRTQALAANSVNLENPRVGGSIPSPATTHSVQFPSWTVAFEPLFMAFRGIASHAIPFTFIRTTPELQAPA